MSYTLYPNAKHLILEGKKRARGKQVRVNLHVTASLADSMYSYFRLPRRPCSHFHVDLKGRVEQYLPLEWGSSADLDGNLTTISIETAGKDDGSEWTSEQVVAIAELWLWIRKQLGIKDKMAENSVLSSTKSHGLSWHRLGIDGNFPSSGILAGRRQRGGGAKYSNVTGKTCPTDPRIKQIPEILELAREIEKGNVSKKEEAKKKPRKKVEEKTALTVNGVLNKATIRAWQREMGTEVDGVISSPSQLVKAVQEHLNSKGWDLEVDGYGIFRNVGSTTPKTKTIQALQEYLGTTADGVLSRGESDAVKALQKLLNKGKGEFKNLPAKKKSSSKNSPKPKKEKKSTPKPATQRVLRRGSSGEDVKSLQRFMNKNYPLYSKLAEDGHYGPATERVIREFKSRAGIQPIDDRVGPVTRKRLGWRN